MQLYMVQAYPEEDFIRVWISVGLALVFAGISIGLWKSTEESSLSDVFSKFMKVSLAFLFFTVVAPTFSSVTDNDGIIQTEESFPMETRLQLLIPSAILVVVFFVLKNLKLNYKFNKSDLLCFYLAIPIVLLWIIKLPTIQLDSSNQRITVSYTHLTLPTN